MRGNFVEQQNRRMAGHIGGELGMRKHQSHQQRLLFSGRATLCLHVLFRMAHEQIDTVRSIKRAARRRVSIPAFAQHKPILVFQIDSRPVERVVHETRERQRCRGEGSIAGTAFDEALQKTQHFIARERHGNAEFRHLLLDTVQPDRIETAFRKQTVAAAHGLFEVACPPSMRGIEREH
ncbi:hypothetical protein D3C87_1687210 [compost metagenome]